MVELIIFLAILRTAVVIIAALMGPLPVDIEDPDDDVTNPVGRTEINPGTGLPMQDDHIDVGGYPYGSLYDDFD